MFSADHSLPRTYGRSSLLALYSPSLARPPPDVADRLREVGLIGLIGLTLDFSKAFDTVRHSTLLRKLAQLDIPDHIYNWLADFFNNHSHCTVFGGELSTLLDVTASIIQGSAIGPAAYVVTTGDLVAAVPGNSLCKYADDTYVIIPASNEASRPAELDNVQRWAEQNNLNLNCNKSTEIIFRDSRRRHTAAEPVPVPGIAPDATDTVHRTC